ncbi:MAG: formylglycine-generating enzyme family protein [Desulfobacterales bacterium]|jgi:formylglycine-generating enzyme required for sulfatase activity
MPETTINSIGMELVLLPAGTFLMGGDWDAEQADENELPQHEISFPKAFYIGKYTVTQSQWQAVMNSSPSEFPGPDRPVENVSHEDACVYIKRLNENENTRTYRLPTEAEWEYAARAGQQSTYCFGPETRRLTEYAWFQNNSGGKTHTVGQLAPNDWGLHDMHGNVHEWCADWYGREYYAASPSQKPSGPRKGVARVLRGGDWGSEAWYCRCAVRSLSSPLRRSPRVGFRVLKDRDEPILRKKSSGMIGRLFAQR